MSEAGGLEAEYQDRVAAGGMFWEVIIQNNESAVPSQDDLVEWADTYGLTMPVLADEAGMISSFASGSYGLPYTMVIDRGMVIDENVGTASVSQMDDLLAE